jgi:hypothetical protein
MKHCYTLLAILIAILFNTSKSNQQNYTISNNADAQWVVVGGGVAGIITVALLLDLGVHEKTITWIDPKFNVGRLGESYTNVPANLQTKQFVRFINQCETFKKVKSASLDKLFNYYDQNLEYPLQTIIEPLRDITDYLRAHVITHAKYDATTYIKKQNMTKLSLMMF